jgi:hypothetical protein
MAAQAQAQAQAANQQQQNLKHFEEINRAAMQLRFQAARPTVQQVGMVSFKLKQ